MANLAAPTGAVTIVRIERSETLPADVDIDAGELIAPDTDGRWILAADGDGLGSKAVALRTVEAGQALTGLQKGKYYPGGQVDALAFGDPVFLSATPGALADATVTEDAVGHVEPHTGAAPYQKIIAVDFR